MPDNQPNIALINRHRSFLDGDGCRIEILKLCIIDLGKFGFVVGELILVFRYFHVFVECADRGCTCGVLFLNLWTERILVIVAGFWEWRAGW